MTRDELIEELKKLPTNAEVQIVTTSQNYLEEEWGYHHFPITRVIRADRSPLNLIIAYDGMSD